MASGLNGEEAMRLLENGSEKSYVEYVEEQSYSSLIVDSLWDLTQTAQNSWKARPSPRVLLRTILIGLLPAPLQSRFTAKAARAEKSYPTAFLDGLRGVAALIVCWCHASYVVFKLGNGYGFEDNRHIMSLPYIRIIYGGAPMVSIFFIISGYALSLKPLKQMNARQHDALLATLSSSTLRRPFRLFLPCMIAGLIVLFMVRIGIYDYTRPIAMNKNLLRNHYEYHQARFPSLSEQLRDYSMRYAEFLHVWSFDDAYAGGRGYDPHQWTIPLEFRASMALFLSHSAIARASGPARRLIVLFLMYFAATWGRWEMILFWAGLLLADLDLWKASRQRPKQEPFAPNTRYFKPSTILWIVLTIIGGYLVSFPEKGAGTTPGYIVLTKWVPSNLQEENRWWQGWGAILIAIAICNEPIFQRFFVWKPIHYLGKVSYPMYLVHGPVIHTFGYLTMNAMWKITGTSPGFFEFGFFLSLCFITGAILWTADLFLRFVDNPCVTFARWVETKCLAS